MQLDRKDYQILVHIREYCKEVRLALESFPQGEEEFELYRN